MCSLRLDHIHESLVLVQASDSPAHALLKAKLPALLTVSPGMASSWRHRSGLGTQKSEAQLDSDSGESEVEGAVVLRPLIHPSNIL